MNSISLTTAGTGVIIPIQSNVLGGYISPTTILTNITVCSATNNNISLPIQPIIGQSYTIVNNGVSPCFVSGGSTTSTINGVGSTNGTNGQFLLASGGCASFIAVTNSGASNTAPSTQALNNPLVVWQTEQQFQSSVAPSVLLSPTLSVLNLTNQMSGTTFLIPSLSNGCAVTLPPNANNAGVNYTFRCIGATGYDYDISAQTATTVKGLYNMYVSGGLCAITPKTAATNCIISPFALTGDVLTIMGDNTNWWVTGIGSAAASFQ